LPGIALMTYVFGVGVLANIAIACIVATACEALMLALRGRPVKTFLSDYSAVVTALLLALALPPLAPWWLPAIGVSFAIVFGKHLYGGLGYNPFNPAMLGYVVLLISFSFEMSQWPAPLLDGAWGAGESLLAVFTGELPAPFTWDAISQATPLDHMDTQLGLARTLREIGNDEIWGVFAGFGWEWINLAFLAGGAWLIYKRVIGWRIPVAVLSGLAFMAAVFWAVDPDANPGVLFHLLSGGIMLGAFFIATDPVTAATTPKGRVIYGLGIGIIVFVIRTWGAYPDGIAFGVLLMNMAAPLIDQYTRPRVYGH
ncbi:MAG: RnfABCDGE type electron transport complex subunit D, partial [Anaerolineae bacterium]|nr:RnfABCDGE type electron transport complex subunit D [Anaerolineae bacterium]